MTRSFVDPSPIYQRELEEVLSKHRGLALVRELLRLWLRNSLRGIPDHTILWSSAPHRAAKSRQLGADS